MTEKEFYEKLNNYEKEVYMKKKNDRYSQMERNKKKLLSPLNDLIRFNPFQYEPYYKLICQTEYPKTVYIADEVGAGKTVETGIILTELLFRREINLWRDVCLLICPNLLCRKWRDTLRSLFGLSASIVHSMDDISAGITIVSFDTISKIEERKTQETHPDVLIIDEAHNASGDRYGEIKKIRANVNRKKGYVILLSATPVSGNGSDEQKQKELLLSGKVVGDFSFSEQAGSDYLCRNKKDIMRCAQQPENCKVEAEISNHFVENEALALFDQCCEALFSGKNTLLRVQGLNQVMSSPAAGLSFLDRLLSKSDDELLDYLKASDEETDADDESEDDYFYEENQYTLEDVGRIREKLVAVKAKLHGENDKKLEKLIEIIRANSEKSGDNSNGEHSFYKHIIVFTDRVAIARYLEEELNKRKMDIGMPCEVFRVTGEMFESEKRARLAQYEKEKEKMSVLIITNVACEGQDMDYGNTIINYDLNYNPVRMEQRRGRVDRFDVKKNKIFIHNFMVRGFDFDPSRRESEQTYSRFSKVKKIWDKIQEIKESTGTYYEILDKEKGVEDKLSVGNMEKKLQTVFGHVIELAGAAGQSNIKNSRQLQEYIVPECMGQFGRYDTVYSLVSDRIRNFGIKIEDREDGRINIVTEKDNQNFLQYVYNGGTLISHLFTEGN